jgi:hypothetical protein
VFDDQKVEIPMRKGFVWGGIAASGLLVVLGIAMIVIGIIGNSVVSDRLSDEKIVGTPDMTPELTRQAVEEAQLTDVVEVPDCSVAGEEIDTGKEAECFARYMRVHALESTGGMVYAEMPRAVSKSTGKPVPEDQASAALASGDAVDNPDRQVWVTETALATALDTSFFAGGVATFAIVVGIALILIGIGFLVLTLGGVRTRVSPSGQARDQAP